VNKERIKEKVKENVERRGGEGRREVKGREKK
jgi:hypothetical protein